MIGRKSYAWSEADPIVSHVISGLFVVHIRRVSHSTLPGSFLMCSSLSVRVPILASIFLNKLMTKIYSRYLIMIDAIVNGIFYNILIFVYCCDIGMHLTFFFSNLILSLATSLTLLLSAQIYAYILGDISMYEIIYVKTTLFSFQFSKLYSYCIYRIQGYCIRCGIF